MAERTCVCGHADSEHAQGVGTCFHITDTGFCACTQFIEQPSEAAVRQAEDRRSLIERMRDGGVLLSEIEQEYFNWEPDPGQGAGLASILNSLNWLGVGVAQPDMGPDEDGPDVVWDGVFVWSDSNIMHYVGQSAPSGDGEPRDIMLDSDTLIQLF